MKITLKAARINAGYSKEQAAELIDITSRTLSNYENGKTKPDIETAYIIASIYGLNINNIFFGANMRETESYDD